jgi:DnaK suppressor protein
LTLRKDFDSAQCMMGTNQEVTMKPLETSSFKSMLLRQREALLRQLDQQRGGDSRVGAATAHRGQTEDSYAQALSERELEMILDDRETAELDAIDAALQRIEEDNYGVCAECGVVISAARLLAAPHALRCIACQKQYERVHPGV